MARSALNRQAPAGGISDPTDGDGLTPLIRATKVGNLLRMQLLLERGADPDAQGPMGFTALMWAVEYDNLAAVKVLVEGKATVGKRTNDGTTALARAAVHGKYEIANFLLAQPKCDPDVPDVYGTTPLYHALLWKKFETAKLILDRTRVVRLDARHFANVFMKSVEAGEETIVEKLLQLGAPVNHHVDGAYLPLHRAYDLDEYRITELLLKHFANPNLSERNCENFRELEFNIIEHAVAKRPHYLKMLLEHGGRAPRLTGGRRTLAQIALQSKQYKSAEILMTWQYFPTVRDINQYINAETIKIIKRVAPLLYKYIMDLLDEQIQRLRAIADKSPGIRDEIARTLSELATRLGAPEGANAEGPAAPIAKNLPEVAPELYAHRSNRQENPEQFIKRVYIDVFGEPAVSGLTQTDLARLDPQLHNRYRNWKVGKALAFEIPTRDSVLANLTAEERLARIRSQTSERRRRSEAVPAAIVEPIEKRLPDVAPELYAARPDRHEDPEQFIMRVYGDPKETGMTQPDLAHLDPQLYNRYRNWKVTHTATLRLPTRDDVIAATPAEEQLGRLRGQAKQAQARYRERLTKGKPTP